jgi:hypothetical protein
MSFTVPIFRSILGLFAFTTILTACVHSRVTRFDPSLALDQRTPPEQIKFYGDQRPTCPYKEVGSVNAEGGIFVSWNRVVKRAREKAHELGGDAIVGVNEKTRISGAILSKDGVSTTESTALRGNVIRFTRASCRE